MQSYSELTFQQNKNAVRPLEFTDLLYHPIADDPEADGATCYSGWEMDHASNVRFYVTGATWFHTVTNANNKQLEAFSEQTLAEVIKTKWVSLPNSGQHWKTFGRPQIQKMRKEPLLPQKAAMLLLACELYITQKIKDGHKFQDTHNGGTEITSGGYIYKRMSILPAVWNIDDLNRKFLREIDSKKQREVSEAIGQPPTVLEDMGNGDKASSAKGHTVTFDTAKKLRAALIAIDHQPGVIRARPGRSIGRRKAADAEMMNRG